MGKVNSILETENSAAYRFRFERMMYEKTRSDKYYVKVFYDGVKFSVQYVKSDYVARIV